MRVAPRPEPRLRLPPKHEDVIPYLMRVERTGWEEKNKSLRALVAGSEPGSPGPTLFTAPSIKFLPRRKAEAASKGPISLQG